MMNFIVFLLIVLNLIKNSFTNENLIAVPDYVSLSIDENKLINTEYFLSTIYSKSINNGNLNYKLKYLPNSKSNLNCTNVSFNELVDDVNEFDINIKNFAQSSKRNNMETIDKVYLVVKSRLDYETRQFYDFCLISSNIKTAVLTVKVKVLDLNDNAPVFEKSEYEASIVEGTQAGFELDLNIKAIDKDSNSAITYSLVADDEENLNEITSNKERIPFEINPLTGRVKCTKVLDREAKSVYKLKLIASDNNPIQPQIGYAKLLIKVLDMNDNKPVVKFLFADSLYEYDFTDLINQLNIFQANPADDTIETTKISENTLEGSFICYVAVVDLDSRENTNIQVELAGNDKKYFHLDKADFDTTLIQLSSTSSNNLIPVLNLYTISLAHELDREISDNYELIFNINDNNQTFINRKLNILVTDSNDNEPKFEKINYNFSVYDDNIGHCFGNVKAYDPDLGLNGTIEYYLVNSTSNCNHSLPFSLNKTTGQLCVIGRVMCLRYELNVQAKDNGVQPLVSKTNASVVVTKRFLSDNRPIFFQQNSNSSAKFNRNSPINSYISWVAAYTLDFGIHSDIEYKIEANTNDSNLNEQLGRLFKIDKNGVLRNEMQFDDILTDEIQVKIIAVNSQLPKLFTEMNMTIELKNDTQSQPNELLFIPNDTILHLTANQIDYLKQNQNLSLIKISLSDQDLTRNRRTIYKIDYIDEITSENCKNSFNIDYKGELYIKNFTKLTSEDICYLNISIINDDHDHDDDDGKIQTEAINIDLIITLANISKDILLSNILFKKNKINKNFLSIDFNQLLIIFLIILFSFLLSILVCLIILMKCRNRNKPKLCKQPNDDGLFVHTDASKSSNDENTTTNTTTAIATITKSSTQSPTSSSTSSIENTTTSSTNSKLTEIESLENLKINNDFSSTSIWLGNHINDSVNNVCLANKQIKNQQFEEANYLQFNNHSGNKLLKHDHQYNQHFHHAQHEHQQQQQHQLNKAINNKKFVNNNNNELIATVHWSPSCTSSISPISTSTATNNFDNNNYFKQNLAKLDEGCYGSSDMSGDSIDVQTVNTNNLNKATKNYCGIYHINTNQACIIDTDDNTSNDSAIQILSEIPSASQQQHDILNLSHQQQQLKCNYQLERFEKLYYEGENSNSNNNNNNCNSLNITVTKYINRHNPIRGSFV